VATLGETGTGTVNDEQSVNFKQAGGGFVAASSGTVTKMTGYISGQGSGTGAQTLRTVLYEDNGSGAPGALVGYSNDVIVADGAAFAWVDFTFGTPCSVVSGHTYWLGYHGENNGGTTQMKAVSGSGIRYNTDAYSGGPADPFGAASTWGSAKWYSLYATYTAAGEKTGYGAAGASSYGPSSSISAERGVGIAGTTASGAKSTTQAGVTAVAAAAVAASALTKLSIGVYPARGAATAAGIAPTIGSTAPSPTVLPPPAVSAAFLGDYAVDVQAVAVAAAATAAAVGPTVAAQAVTGSVAEATAEFPVPALGSVINAVVAQATAAANVPVVFITVPAAPPSVPRFRLQAAFGNGPGDSSYTWTTIGDSITTIASGTALRSFHYSRGRQNELNRVEAGISDILLSDPNSALDPNNTASPYYPNVKPMCPVRVYCTIDGVDYPMFLHHAERWPRSLRISDRYTERQLSCNDGFAWLALAGLAGATYPQQTSGQRFAAVLDTAGWPISLRNIAPGDSSVAGRSFGLTDSDKALEHLQAVTETEDGLMFVNAAGKVTLINRHALIINAIAPATLTLHDLTFNPPNTVKYQGLTPSFDLDNVFNDWSGTREGGVTQTATDAASVAAYGPRSQQLASLAIDDDEVLASVQWKVNQFGNPQDRIAQVEVMPGGDVRIWKALLAIELGDRVNVAETPPGTAGWTVVYQVQRLEVTVPPDIVAAKFTFQLWPASISNWLILDDAVYGRLDSANLLAY